MKRKHFIAAVICSVALCANASQIDKSEKCPSILSIKQTGFQHINKFGEIWYAWSQAKFSTHHKWLFGLFVPDG